MNQEAIARMCAITISREYGSGGGEISRRLAARLGWRLIDHEIVARVAQELHVSEAEAASHDEYAESLLGRVLLSMRSIQPATVSLPTPLETDIQAYHAALRRVVETAAAAGHVVIVGRGGQVLLATRRDVLHVRIVASLEQRVRYVMRREGLDEAAAHARIQHKDRDRIRYLQAFHHQHPADPHLYDLVINTSLLDLESAVDLIILALERKAARLSTPVEQLGPAAGLAPYPGQPADFHQPESIIAQEPEANI